MDRIVASKRLVESTNRTPKRPQNSLAGSGPSWKGLRGVSGRSWEVLGSRGKILGGSRAALVRCSGTYWKGLGRVLGPSSNKIEFKVATLQVISATNKSQLGRCAGRVHANKQVRSAKVKNVQSKTTCTLYCMYCVNIGQTILLVVFYDCRFAQAKRNNNIGLKVCLHTQGRTRLMITNRYQTVEESTVYCKICPHPLVEILFFP